MTDPHSAILAALDARRVFDHCDALGRLSELEGGLTRVFLSPQQREANALVLGWMREAGMSADLDAMGNCVGRYEGSTAGLPCLMLGSHLDTVRDAGKYDGMLGVLSASECVAALEGLPVHHLPSGAGHDGMALIDIAPIGMLFVRCKEGIAAIRPRR